MNTSWLPTCLRKKGKYRVGDLLKRHRFRVNDRWGNVKSQRPRSWNPRRRLVNLHLQWVLFGVFLVLLSKPRHLICLQPPRSRTEKGWKERKSDKWPFLRMVSAGGTAQHHEILYVESELQCLVRWTSKVFYLLCVACWTLAVGQYWKCDSNLTHHMEILISPWDLFNIRLERTSQMGFFSPANWAVWTSLPLIVSLMHHTGRI